MAKSTSFLYLSEEDMIKAGVPDSAHWRTVFYDALQDLRALKLCENLYGRDYAVALPEQDIDPITVTSYPHEAAYLLALRRRLNAAIKEKVTP